MIKITSKQSSVVADLAYGALNSGGATVSPRGDAPAAFGYMVGGLVQEVIVPKGGDLPLPLIDFTLANWDVATQPETDRYFGSWLNEDTGSIHLDVSEWYEDLGTALRVARERDELAIWDVSGKVAIPAGEQADAVSYLA